MNTTESIAIRAATEADHWALVRLAALDSAPYPARPALVAEQDGVILAALPLPRGRAIADPFRSSAHALELLELRAAQLEAPERRRGLRVRLSLRRKRVALPAVS